MQTCRGAKGRGLIRTRYGRWGDTQLEKSRPGGKKHNRETEMYWGRKYRRRRKDDRSRKCVGEK